MRDAQLQPKDMLLDACAILSLYATRRMDQILRDLGSPVAVADLVVDEALFIRHIVNGEVEREHVNLVPVIESELLHVVHAESEKELLTFIDLAVELDDGEAMSGALAIHRDLILVTDDRKAEQLLEGRISMRSTLEVIKDWAETQRIGGEALHAVLIAIDQRGYRPGRRHPLHDWWEGVMLDD